MTNRVNEYLRQRPLLGAVVLMAMVVVGTTVWILILEASQSLTGALTDVGFWFTISLIALPMGLLYYFVSKRT